MKKFKAKHWLALAVFLYILVFSFLTIMRHLSSKYGDPDFSIFDQSFYTTLKYGMLFYNTFEEHSHFGQHNSPIFFLLLPFYALYPSMVTLNILQSIALGLGALPLFLIAKERLGDKTALCFSVLYLLYHPLHGINYDQFSELSFAVAPLLFALYFFLKRRFAAFWLCFFLTLMCKEDFGFVAVFWGIYTAFLASFSEKLPEGSSRFKLVLFLNGLAMIIIGISHVYLSLYVLIPHFKSSQAYGYLAERYATFGKSLPEVLLTIIRNPLLVLGFLLEKERILYFLEMFLPLAFIPFRSPGLLLMTIPIFLINTLSSSGMHTTASRYNAYLVPFIFTAGVRAFQKILALKPQPDKTRSKLLKLIFTLTILCTVFINNTPLRIGWKIPWITPRQKLILSLVKTIPPEVSISTQADILQHVCHRVHAYSGYYPNSDYIFVDEKSKWYAMHARWDDNMPKVLATGQYQKIFEQDGIKIYRRKDFKP